MDNYTSKEKENIYSFKNNIEVKELNYSGCLFINCSNIYPKKKLYNLYISYFEECIFKAQEISKKNNKKGIICHINLENIRIKNFSMKFIRLLNNKINNNVLLEDSLDIAYFYYKNIITKKLYDFIYSIIDKDTRKKYKLIKVE